MFKLPNDVINLIARHLSLPDLIGFYNTCVTLRSKRPRLLFGYFNTFIEQMSQFQKQQQARYRSVGIQRIRRTSRIYEYGIFSIYKYDTSDISYELIAEYRLVKYHIFAGVNISGIDKINYLESKPTMPKPVRKHFKKLIFKMASYNDIGIKHHALAKLNSKILKRIHKTFEDVVEEYARFNRDNWYMLIDHQRGDEYNFSSWNEYKLYRNDSSQDNQILVFPEKYTQTIDYLKYVLEWKSTYYKS